MPFIRLLSVDEWLTLRDLRLSALRDSPDAFLASHGEEEKRAEDGWRAEFARGDWAVIYAAERPIGLIGITREPDTPVDECYLEFLWVAPPSRRQGTACTLMNWVLDHLRTRGVLMVFLWVLDGNDNAIRLYDRLGFISSNYRQPLEARPGRTEERMELKLT